MKKNKNFIKCAAVFLGLFIIYVVLISLFSYFDILGGTTLKIINFVVITLFMFLSGFSLATHYENRGYKAGIIMGIINMAILFMISIIVRSEINTNTVVYFLILLLSSSIGGMAGINFKSISKTQK